MLLALRFKKMISTKCALWNEKLYGKPKSGPADCIRVVLNYKFNKKNEIKLADEQPLNDKAYGNVLL